MKTIEINLYEFNELSDKAKQKAINNWYDSEDYSFLEDNLTESLKALLEQNGCEYDNLQVMYSLSYSQGDGLCFTGEISKNGKRLVLSHNYRYYFATSVDFTFFDEDGEETEEDSELKDIYLSVCKELEEEGYSIIEYRMTNEEFSEHCTINGCFFYEDGTME